MRAPGALVVVLLFCTAARADDTAPPVITHTPVAKGEKGKQTPVVARITDESKIFPQVFYRFVAGAQYEKPIDMKLVKGQKNQWGANLPPPPGSVLEYYIEAYDEFGNGPARAGDPDKPFAIDFVPAEVAQERSAPPPALPSRPPPKPGAQAPGGGRLWTWVVGGTGLGLLAGGLVAGLAVKSADDAYKARLADPSNNPATLQQQYDANHSLGTKATILTVAGLTLLAGGVALYFVEAPTGGGGVLAGEEQRGGVGVAVAPANGGAAVAVAGRF